MLFRSTQFSSDLDATTKEQLTYGDGLMELLKQPLYHPMSLSHKVITLCAATHKAFLDIDKSKIKDFQNGLLDYFDRQHPEVGSEIESTGQLSDELISKIMEITAAYKSKK